MKKHSRQYLVVKDDLDELDHVNNLRYIEWVQSIAKEHWLQEANADIRARYFWILTEHHIQYKKPACLNDNLWLETFVTNSSGASSERMVEIFNADTKQLLVVSKTTWCLMDGRTQKPSRMTDEIAKLFV
ncbi:MAG: acyl-CoA thioesterase [Bacteroidetes bacterium]|jgi:acyl-CoA thioester hydrolase|nr:acyl-CoA thioesterase [Bacteroidota bacterium]MDA0880101.1 acyl-CoA thioesterase [Bacteroidota bacterium]MDA1116229.1 acyl-CoA thioesterase [Bacteroidota bacterium]